jgi:hypothetical protein
VQCVQEEEDANAINAKWTFEIDVTWCYLLISAQRDSSFLGPVWPTSKLDSILLFYFYSSPTLLRIAYYYYYIRLDISLLVSSALDWILSRSVFIRTGGKTWTFWGTDVQLEIGAPSETVQILFFFFHFTACGFGLETTHNTNNNNKKGKEKKKRRK